VTTALPPPVSVALTTIPYDPLLDLAPWIGQRQASFRFDLVNRVSGIRLGEIHPIRSASLSHDTGRSTKRQLNLTLGTSESASINPITDMVNVFMVFPGGQEWPLGQYVFTDASYQIFTAGQLANMILNDLMYIVDQPIEKGFTARNAVSESFFASGSSIPVCITNLLTDLPIKFDIESSPYASVDSWSAGATRGSIIETLSLTGNYFSPWFGNDGVMHFIQAFNPANRIPDFDWDRGNQVMRSSILQSSNILNAPNRFIVISNAPANRNEPTFGVADVPVNAPHSIENRGFVIPVVQDLQALSKEQCAAIASNLVQRQTVFETSTVTTAPDPRHDSYNVIKWQDELWLELAWTLPLTEGSQMTHTLRKAYK
jgi:hypothetical protein